MVVLRVREGTLRPGVNPDRVVLLGIVLLCVASCGFYYIPGLIDKDAEGTRAVNAFYCAIMTLTTVGFGDICPSSEIEFEGRMFIVVISLVGLGFVCGPLLNLTAVWHRSIPGGMVALASFTLALGVVIFGYAEGLPHTHALYASVVTGTTIGYGDMTPSSDMGRIAVALYALLCVNTMGAVLEDFKEILVQFCRFRPPTYVEEVVASAKDEDAKKDL